MRLSWERCLQELVKVFDIIFTVFVAPVVFASSVQDLRRQWADRYANKVIMSPKQVGRDISRVQFFPFAKRDVQENVVCASDRMLCHGFEQMQQGS